MIYKLKKTKVFASYLILTCLFFMIFSTMILGETSSEKLRDSDGLLEVKAHDIISSQIEAFRKSDINTAYTFASPFIKSKFSNAEKFGEMVQTGYPMIWSPKNYEFLDFDVFNGALIQRVLFIDLQERIFIFDYEIREYKPNIWLINGVYPVKSSTSGA